MHALAIVDCLLVKAAFLKRGQMQALPTCLLFRDGKVIDRVDGFMPEQSFGKRVRFYVARLDKKFGRR